MVIFNNYILKTIVLATLSLGVRRVFVFPLRWCSKQYLNWYCLKSWIPLFPFSTIKMLMQCYTGWCFLYKLWSTRARARAVNLCSDLQYLKVQNQLLDHVYCVIFVCRYLEGSRCTSNFKLLDLRSYYLM